MLILTLFLPLFAEFYYRNFWHSPHYFVFTHFGKMLLWPFPAVTFWQDASLALPCRLNRLVVTPRLLALLIYPLFLRLCTTQLSSFASCCCFFDLLALSSYLVSYLSLWFSFNLLRSLLCITAERSNWSCLMSVSGFWRQVMRMDRVSTRIARSVSVLPTPLDQGSNTV